MIINNKEYFSSPYYFFLKEGNNKYSLYFSIEDTLNEARKKDEVVHFKKEKIEMTLKNFSKFFCVKIFGLEKLNIKLMLLLFVSISNEQLISGSSIAI